MDEKTIIRLQNISVSFDEQPVLQDLNLKISDGEFVTLLGPSGCGKTTTLRIIGGFVKPDSGDVFFDEKPMTALPPHKRPVNTIFQRYALFPHLNVFENVAFGMRVQKRSSAEIRENVAKMLKMVNLTGFEKRSVHTLSGGQQQRVAIARAIAGQPPLLLADEPTGNRDRAAGEQVMALLLGWHRAGNTVILITHDEQIGAACPRCLRMRDGRLLGADG